VPPAVQRAQALEQRRRVLPAQVRRALDAEPEQQAGHRGPDVRQLA
jgi:hypothetical protein